MNETVRRILVGVAVVIGGFLAFRLLNLLMVWSLYSWFFQMIKSAAGIPDTLNGAFSIWLVAITVLLLPTFFSILFWKRDPKKVALIVGAISAWLVVVYFISQPKEGRFFNPMTGQAMYRYSPTPEGKIDLFPLGYKFHPRYGNELQLVTPHLVREMDKKAAEEKTRQEQERQKAAAYAVAHPPAPIATQQQHGSTPTFHPFGVDGCYETSLGYEARWSPKDKAMRVYDPAGGSHIEELGKKSPISAFGPGTWRFCKEDPDATGVVIWK